MPDLNSALEREKPRNSVNTGGVVGWARGQMRLDRTHHHGKMNLGVYRTKLRCGTTCQKRTQGVKTVSDSLGVHLLSTRRLIFLYAQRGSPCIEEGLSRNERKRYERPHVAVEIFDRVL